MGNFNLKNIWAPKTGGGGSIPSNLEQRVQELENNTLKLNNNYQLQIVHHGVDFYENIVCKKEAFVDVVGNENTNITNKQYVDTKDAQNVKITGDQSIAGVKTFTGGLISRSSTEFGTEIKAGYGGTEVYFTPEDTSTKTLKYGRSGSGRFNMDLENQSQLMGIKDPTADYHAANKKYVDGKFKYVRKVNNNGFTINANAYQSAEFSINGLTTGLNEFYIVLTTSSIDIGFEVKIQCNNLNYPNMSDIKTISTSNFTNSNVDNLGTLLVGFVVYGNNKIRFRMKNNHSSNITFNGFRIYHRIPGVLADS